MYTSHKTTATESEVALSYHRLRGLHFLAIVFVRSIHCSETTCSRRYKKNTRFSAQY